MKEKSFVMQKPLINKNENMNFTRFSRMLFVLKKNTIVKRKNIEIITSTKYKAFRFLMYHTGAKDCISIYCSMATGMRKRQGHEDRRRRFLGKPTILV